MCFFLRKLKILTCILNKVDVFIIFGYYKRLSLYDFISILIILHNKIYINKLISYFQKIGNIEVKLYLKIF
jgi:hypothetical protein